MMPKVALVTGSARRIGAEIVRFLHANGYKVVIHYRNSLADAEMLVGSLNAKLADSAKLVCSSLNSETAAQDLIQQSIHAWGRLDVIVNNASVFSCNTKDYNQMLLLNVQIPCWLSYHAITELKKNHGNIINITDTHATRPLANYALYCQTKAALRMQTKALAKEFAPKVRVNAVAPGAIIWPEADNALNDGKKHTIIANTPLQKHGEPLHIAKAVFALLDNDFITGQELVVDGGRNI